MLVGRSDKQSVVASLNVDTARHRRAHTINGGHWRLWSAMNICRRKALCDPSLYYSRACHGPHHRVMPARSSSTGSLCERCCGRYAGLFYSLDTWLLIWSNLVPMLNAQLTEIWCRKSLSATTTLRTWGWWLGFDKVVRLSCIWQGGWFLENARDLLHRKHYAKLTMLLGDLSYMTR